MACSPGQRGHRKRGQGTLSRAAQLVPRMPALAGPSWQQEEEGPSRPRAGDPHPIGRESPGPQACKNQLHLSSLRPLALGEALGCPGGRAAPAGTGVLARSTGLSAAGSQL